MDTQAKRAFALTRLFDAVAKGRVVVPYGLTQDERYEFALAAPIFSDAELAALLAPEPDAYVPGVFVPVSDPAAPRTRKRLVITVATGSEHEALLKISGPLFGRYAQNVQADFIALTGKTQCWWGLEKFRIKRYVEQYERTLFLDADILIRGGAPDIFSFVPEGSIGMHNDRIAHPNLQWAETQRRALWESQGVADWQPNHLRNSGVVVCDQLHAAIWTPPPRPVPGEHCDEQFWVERASRHYLNFELPLEFNVQWYYRDYEALKGLAWFLHLANCPPGLRKRLMEREVASGNRRSLPTDRPAVCGCTHVLDKATAVLRRESICEPHLSVRTDPRRLAESYFASNAGSPHVDELIANLGPVPRGKGLAIEIGAGLSNYQPYLVKQGYTYMAVDPAASLREHYAQCGASFQCASLESAQLPESQLVLMAHSLEHVQDLAGGLKKIAASLRPRGLLYIVVPFGPDDLLNADHDWFFTQDTLSRALRQFGFAVEAAVLRRVVDKERFIYCKAVKL